MLSCVCPEDRGPVIIACFNCMQSVAYHVVRLANQHAQPFETESGTQESSWAGRAPRRRAPALPNDVWPRSFDSGDPTRPYADTDAASLAARAHADQIWAACRAAAQRRLCCDGVPHVCQSLHRANRNVRWYRSLWFVLVPFSLAVLVALGQDVLVLLDISVRRLGNGLWSERRTLGGPLLIKQSGSYRGRRTEAAASCCMGHRCMIRLCEGTYRTTSCHCRRTSSRPMGHRRRAHALAARQRRSTSRIARGCGRRAQAHR